MFCFLLSNDPVQNLRVISAKFFNQLMHIERVRCISVKFVDITSCIWLAYHLQ